MGSTTAPVHAIFPRLANLALGLLLLGASNPDGKASSFPMLSDGVIAESELIFRGYVVASGQSNIAALGPSASLALLRVNKLFKSNERFRHELGKYITIRLVQANGVESGRTYVFGANPWLVAESFAVTEVAHVIAAPPPITSQVSGTVNTVSRHPNGAIVSLHVRDVATSLSVNPANVTGSTTSVVLSTHASVHPGYETTLDVSSLNLPAPRAVPARPSQELEIDQRIAAVDNDEENTAIINRASKAISVVVAKVIAISSHHAQPRDIAPFEHAPLLRTAKLIIIQYCKRGNITPTSILFIDRALSRDVQWQDAPSLAVDEEALLLLRAPSSIGVNVAAFEPQLGVFQTGDVADISHAWLLCRNAAR